MGIVKKWGSVWWTNYEWTLAHKNTKWETYVFVVLALANYQMEATSPQTAWISVDEWKTFLFGPVNKTDQNRGGSLHLNCATTNEATELVMVALNSLYAIDFFEFN